MVFLYLGFFVALGLALPHPPFKSEGQVISLDVPNHQIDELFRAQYKKVDQHLLNQEIIQAVNDSYLDVQDGSWIGKDVDTVEDDDTAADNITEVEDTDDEDDADEETEDETDNKTDDHSHNLLAQ